MKRTLIALSLVAVLGVAACENGVNQWTPMSDGRTAGEGVVAHTQPAHKADKTFSQSLHK